ncbi:hypothetical protein [Mycobacterium heckeshornense]|uniref:hypothetical protein n=1 Tax=Mycobacterium heckeshornense TaxID=110505 RepID=UPI0019438753|nr:hypothetical protein [Mycobacterium heckeshornense]
MTAARQDWSELLFGHQRPKGLEIISNVLSSRETNAVAHSEFASQLAQQQFTSLLNQEGATADDIREAHYRSEQHHRSVEETNETLNGVFAMKLGSGRVTRLSA